MFCHEWFWKVSSRKIFAVNQANLKGKSRKRGPVVISDSESDDSPLEPLCRRKVGETSQQLADEVREMRKDIQCLFKITTKITRSLQGADTFHCHICHSTLIKPPVTFS